jgi:type IX secretion system PorP/SprF family membrane protein
VGFEGAPVTGSFNVHAPLKKKNMAFGLSFQNDVIGARNASFIGAAYSYSLRLDQGGKKKISFGIQGGAINYRFDWDALEYNSPGDPVSFSTNGNFWLPNFDVGAMYLAPKGYFGVSVSGLGQARLTEAAEGDGRLSTALNAQTGHVFLLSESLSLKPFAFLRYDLSGPAQFDLGVSALLVNRIWIGGAYRHDFGTVLSMQLLAGSGLVIGYAFDWALNNLVASQSGTHELFLGFDLGFLKQSKRIARYY